MRAPELAGLWDLGEKVADGLARRAKVLGDFLRPAPPDYCEMGIVANAVGLMPSRPELHYPVCRTPELAEVFIPAEDGGILEKPGVVEVFRCLRRPDEASFSGGMFVVFRCADDETWRILRAKGHLVSRNLKYACIYRPYNLMGVEAVTSVFSAVLHGRPTGAARPENRVALVGRAERKLAAGEVLAMGGHHHVIDGVRALLLPAAESAGKAPYYLAAGKRLVRDVSCGEDIPIDALDLDGSALYAAWRELNKGVS
jgi:predicted homoserine dehydrogenase-like protein